MDTTFAHTPLARYTLRQILAFDAITCLAFGLLLTLGAAPLAAWLGLPQALLFRAGVVLFPSAALMFAAARNPAPGLVWTVIAGNAAWVVARASWSRSRWSRRRSAWRSCSRRPPRWPCWRPLEKRAM